MKKSFFYSLVLIVMAASFNFADSKPNLLSRVERDSMEFIRTTFYNAIEDESELEKLEEFIKLKYSSERTTYSALILAYVGGIEALHSQGS